MRIALRSLLIENIPGLRLFPLLIAAACLRLATIWAAGKHDFGPSEIRVSGFVLSAHKNETQ